MKCPGLESLIDYAEGRLALQAAGAVKTHLDGCHKCDADRRWYETTLAIASSDNSLAPPTWVLKRAFRIFEEGFTGKGVVGKLVAKARRLIAELVFDSGVQAAMAGARSSGPDPRQMLYRAAEYSIDIQLAALDQKCVGISGQLLREGELMFESVAGRRLSLVRGGTVFSTVTNDRGEFKIHAIDSGSYDLEIDTHDVNITIVGLSVM